MSIQKDVSNKQELEVAKKLGGRITPSSGSGQFSGGDVVVGDFLIECKTTVTEKASFSIKKAWLEKIKEQAFEQRKSFSALAFRFEPDGSDFIVVDIDLFKDMIDALEENNNTLR